MDKDTEEILDNQENIKNENPQIEPQVEDVPEVEDLDEESTVRDILNSDMTPTQALNFLVSGVQIALEGDFYEMEDKLILEKSLGVMFDQHKLGKDFTIKV